MSGMDYFRAESDHLSPSDLYRQYRLYTRIACKFDYAPPLLLFSFRNPG